VCGTAVGDGVGFVPAVDCRGGVVEADDDAVVCEGDSTGVPESEAVAVGVVVPAADGVAADVAEQPAAVAIISAAASTATRLI
jgi:hypothetical protein